MARRYRINADRRVTIPPHVMKLAGLRPGDVMRVYAKAPREIVLVQVARAVTRTRQ